MSVKVQFHEPFYEVYVRGGDERDVQLLLDVVDKLRNEYGINVYLRADGDEWLYGSISDGLKIFVCGKEISLNESEQNLNKIELLVDKILSSISLSRISSEENISSINEGPGRFFSAEYVIN